MTAFWRRTDPTAAPDASMASRAVLSTAGVVVQGGVRFVYSALLGRAAGAAVLGAVNAAISLALLASLLWPAATAQAASTFVARSRGADDPRAAVAVAALLARWTLVSSLLLGGLTAAFWATRGHGDPASVVSVGALVVAYSGYGFVRAVAFGAGQVRRATVWDVVTAGVSVAGLVAVLVLDAMPWVLAPLVLGYALYAVQGWPRGTFRLGVDPVLRAELRHFVMLGVVGGVAVGGLLQLTMVVAERADTPERAGQYAAVLTLATPAALLSRSLSLVLLPALAEARGRGDGVQARRTTDTVTRVLLSVSVVAFGSVALAADLVVPLVFGPGFAPSVDLLPPMLLAVFLGTATVGAVNSLLAGGRGGVWLVNGINLAGLLTGCLGWLLLVPGRGVDGVVLGYLAGSAVVGTVPYVSVWRSQGHRWAGLTARVVTSGLLVGAGLAVRPELADHLGAAAGVTLAAAFAVLAGALLRAELGLLWPLLRRHRSVTADR